MEKPDYRKMSLYDLLNNQMRMGRIVAFYFDYLQGVDVVRITNQRKLQEHGLEEVIDLEQQKMYANPEDYMRLVIGRCAEQYDRNVPDDMK